MPIMDWWEFLEEFVEIPTPKVITIFIVTSSIDPADVKLVAQFDIVKKYVIKPITVDKLKEILLEF